MGIYRPEEYAPKRKRGRPSADVPTLTPAQRRARNAEYERERRQDEQAAYAELAKAICSDEQKVARADILRKTVIMLREMKSIDELRQENELLKMQIKQRMAALENDDQSP